MSSSATTTAPKRVFVVTGSNTGVGFQTALQLAVGDSADERHIILACRTISKAEAAVAKIRAALPQGRSTIVECMRLDLVDLRSIEAFVAEFVKRALPLHCLVNNAGVNAAPLLGQPALALEGQFVANYLGPYVLTKLLLPTLEASAPSRIINVSSYMHRHAGIKKAGDFGYQCRRGDKASYSASKLAQIYHSLSLQIQYGGRGVTSFVAHPGACASDIWLTLNPASLRPAAQFLARNLFLSTAQGAATSVHAATKEVSADPTEVEHFSPYPTVAGWEFYTDAWQPNYFTRVTKSKTDPITEDEAIRTDLAQLSEELYAEWQAAAKEQDGQ